MRYGRFFELLHYLLLRSYHERKLTRQNEFHVRTIAAALRLFVEWSRAFGAISILYFSSHNVDLSGSQHAASLFVSCCLERFLYASLCSKDG